MNLQNILETLLTGCLGSASIGNIPLITKHCLACNNPNKCINFNNLKLSITVYPKQYNKYNSRDTGTSCWRTIVKPHKLIHKEIATFFSPITPNGRSQSRDTKMGSRPGHNKGVTIGQAMAIRWARRPRPHGPQPHHPCYRQIKAIISCHRRCFPCFRDLSILDRPMLEIFRRQKLWHILFENLTCAENQII